MILECLDKIAFPVDAQASVDTFLSYISEWHSDVVQGERILVESGPIKFNNKDCQAVCATSFKNTRDGETQVLGITALIIAEG